MILVKYLIQGVVYSMFIDMWAIIGEHAYMADTVSDNIQLFKDN